MRNANVIKETANFVQSKLQGEGSGHDWWHIYRVWNLAKIIARYEHADLFVIQIAALLHDIADWKLHDGDEEIGPRLAKEWLEKQKVDKSVISHVCEIIAGISFKGAGVASKLKTIEGRIVQDADRLDALGAIGIGRTFAFGGYKQREMYNPDIKVHLAKNFEEYKAAGQTTINHFYEKLLLLKDLMNTVTARKMAVKRHKYMENFLKEFFMEWSGKI